MDIGRSCKTKQKKKNNLEFLCENELYWFWSWPVNRRFCTRGWRPSKRTPPKNIEFIQFCEKGKQNSYVKGIIPLGSNSAIVYISPSVSSLCCSVEDEADWSMSSELDGDTGFWMRGDPMRHSITLLIPNFCMDHPFGFSAHRDTLFCPSRLFRFSTCRVYIFFIFIPYFCPNPFGSPGSPNFCLGMST